MQHWMIDATDKATSQYSSTINTEKYRTFSVQMITQDTTGTTKVTGWIQGSNDKQHWVNIAKLEVDGTQGGSSKTDGGVFQTMWTWMRFHLETSTAAKKVNVFLATGE